MPKPTNSLPSYEEAVSHFAYIPETGDLIWIQPTSNRVFAGKPAGNIIPATGYIGLNFNGKNYLAHRLCWLLYYKEDPGEMEVDHINGNRSDNRIENLRLASSGENVRNAAKRCDNTSGVKGVFWCNRKRRWIAKVSLGGKTRQSQHEKIEDAKAAVQRLRAELHGDFTNHG